MHTLQTTLAYVIDVYPHGESSNVYKLFTRELGLLYAHAQSVRELKSRNRYVLQVGQLVCVTLVRGREVWRVTSVQALPEKSGLSKSAIPRKLLALIGKLVAVEDDTKRVFDHLVAGDTAMTAFTDEDRGYVEAIVLLRVMDTLGFVARPLEEEHIRFFLETNDCTDEHVRRAREHKELLFVRVNTALEEAR